jgi:hypothetical protein
MTACVARKGSAGKRRGRKAQRLGKNWLRRPPCVLRDAPGPALVLAVRPRPDEGTNEVLVLAITHTPSAAPEGGVSIPPDVMQRIGLDDAPSWIVTTEANAFIWPGPDIRPVPGRTQRIVVYGRIPDGLLRRPLAPSSQIGTDNEPVASPGSLDNPAPPD